MIFGRTVFESSDTGMTYEEAASMALGDIPVINHADIGHTAPMMTMINGAVLNLVYKNNKMTLSFSLV